jgi:hypothetical protein
MNSHEQDHWPVEADELATGHGGNFEANNYYTTDDDNYNNNNITSNNNDAISKLPTEETQHATSRQSTDKNLFVPWGCTIKKADQTKLHAHTS